MIYEIYRNNNKFGFFAFNWQQKFVALERLRSALPKFFAVHIDFFAECQIVIHQTKPRHQSMAMPSMSVHCHLETPGLAVRRSSFRVRIRCRIRLKTSDAGLLAVEGGRPPLKN